MLHVIQFFFWLYLILNIHNGVLIYQENAWTLFWNLLGKKPYVFPYQLRFWVEWNQGSTSRENHIDQEKNPLKFQKEKN